MTKRKTIAFTLSLFMFSGINAYSQKIDNPVQYLDYIGKEFKQVSTEMWDYTSAAAHGKKARTVENKRRELITQLNKSITKIKTMPGYEGNTAYRDSVVSYLTINKLVLNEEYAKIVDMEEVSEQSYDAMEAYMLIQEKASDKQKEASEMLDKEEQKFADENHIKLTESETKIGKKLKEAGEVYKYYNPIYLIFFKSYKQEMFLIDAQNKGDFNAMEQNKNALAQNSAEGIAKLALIKDYKGDMSVKAACLDMLKFYQRETTKYNEISNFYIQKDKFDKIKASFDAKDASKRTQQDVDQFNAAVKEYNAASTKYNALNQDLSQNRARLLDNWNKASTGLIDKFVPKKR